ncbi:MAG: hypothetical protein ABJL99_12675 [Aliishimia sp.]
MFDMLPQKLERRHSKNSAILWPECGSSFELNIFYRRYESCGGEIGEGFIFCWSAKEIMEYESLRTDIYPNSWKIFGGDGGGTHFGFCQSETGIFFFSCDPIDPTGSVTWLGAWSEFIQRVSQGSCIDFNSDEKQSGH